MVRRALLRTAAPRTAFDARMTASVRVSRPTITSVIWGWCCCCSSSCWCSRIECSVSATSFRACTVAAKSKTGKSWTESRREIASLRGREGLWDCSEERSLVGEKMVLFRGWIMNVLLWGVEFGVGVRSHLVRRWRGSWEVSVQHIVG